MAFIVFGILIKWISTYKTWNSMEMTLCFWGALLSGSLSLATLNLPEGFTEFNSRQAYLDVKSNIRTLYLSIDNTTTTATATSTSSSVLSVSTLAEVRFRILYFYIA